MTKEQQKKLKKFKEFTSWMYGDSELALYLAQAQFLVALGLFQYIETLGTFRLGYFEKKNGKIKLHIPKGKNIKCQGCSRCVEGKIKTESVKRFNEFFGYLGDEYKKLIGTHQEIYNELRCGLSHEFLPKKRRFTFYHLGSGAFTKEQIDNNCPIIDLCSDNLRNNIDGSTVSCGIVLSKSKDKEMWQVFVPKLAADFRRAVKKFIREIEEEKDRSLLDNFFETANQINMENF